MNITQSASAAAMKWRDNLNPQRGLTVNRVVQLLETFNRGDFADLFWTMAAPVVGVASMDADLKTIVDGRADALLEMDWDIRVRSDLPDTSPTPPKSPKNSA